MKYLYFFENFEILYSPFMTISLISSWANEELVRLYNVIQFNLNEKEHLTICKQNMAFPHAVHLELELTSLRDKHKNSKIRTPNNCNYTKIWTLLVYHQMRWPKTCRQLHCLPFCLHLFDEGAVWSGSTLFAISFASFGWGSSLIRVYTVILFAHLVDEGAVWSESTLFAIWLAHLVDEGAVWSGSTPFAILCASFWMKAGHTVSILFAIPFASFGWRSSLIRVYTVCNSIASFGWRSSLIRVYTVCNSIASFGWRSSLIWVYTVCNSIASFGWRSSLIWVYTVCNSIASFGWRSSLIWVYTVCNLFCLICACMFLSFFSSSWCWGLAAVCIVAYPGLFY